jgi:hypothetical protein
LQVPKGRDAVSTSASTIIVRPEPGDAVRLSDFRPVECASLVRIGGPHDGGYVVPLDAVTSADALLSFGLAHNWTFEQDFAKYNPRATIHCYDHTVSTSTTIEHSIGQLFRFLARRDAGHLRQAFTWLDYPRFFRGRNAHFRQRIWHDHQFGSATADDAFARLPSGSKVFVKVDVEGGEYRIMDDLLRHAADIVALAIEFHDVDILPERFTELIGAIKRDFEIVHFHANNMGGLAPFHFPNAPEITFLNKRCFDVVPTPSLKTYPIAGLDAPNQPRFPDYKIEF